jgi:hypothetical protein
MSKARKKLMAGNYGEISFARSHSILTNYEENIEAINHRLRFIGTDSSEIRAQEEKKKIDYCFLWLLSRTQTRKPNGIKKANKIGEMDQLV